MTLLEHVLNIRLLIHRAFNGKMERLGIEAGGYADRPSLSEADLELRRRLQDINDTHISENGGNFAAAREYTLKQCVFTLFNRLAAIKLMEHKDLFPEVIKQRAENGGLSAAHQAWLEQHPEGRSLEREGLLEFFTDRFAEIAETIPLYRADYPYSLMPTADELNQIIRAFNAIEADEDCAEAWLSDDILGWLYENFNSAEKVKFKESGEKTEYDKVSLQSQVYTPSWVVKFLVDNTLGKLYFEMFPESRLDVPDGNGNRRLMVANRPTQRTRERKAVSELRVIDPACGSGNFLLYAFDLLYDIYTDQSENFGADYSRREIPALILENNLYGLDLDERAVQMAQIALFIKAKERGGRRARTPRHTNVVCTNFTLPTYDEVRGDFGYDGPSADYYDRLARKLWTDISEAHKFGSLVRIEEQLRVVEDANKLNSQTSLFPASEQDDLFNEGTKLRATLHQLVNAYGQKVANPYTLSKMNEAMAFLDIISLDYDVVVANPPYTDRGDFGQELKAFVEENYRRPLKFNSNLYACFIKRCCEFAGKKGKVGMIHPLTFMFIKSFVDVRKYILENWHIHLFVDYGLDRINMFKGTGYASAPAFYVLDSNNDNSDSIFFELNVNLQEKDKKARLSLAYDRICNNLPDNRTYRIQQEDLKGIKLFPFIYWISNNYRNKFSAYYLGKKADVVSGFKTGCNEALLRFWWEVEDDVKWVVYTKGGFYNKWYGNNWLKLNVENDFSSLKAQNSYNIPRKYFQTGLTYNGLGSKGLCFRLLENNTLFDMGSSAVFGTHTFFVLGVLNSILIKYSCNCLNPTVNVQPTDVERLPFIDIDTISSEIINDIGSLSEQNVEIKKLLCKSSMIEPLFDQSPVSNEGDAGASIYLYFNKENALLTQILLNESIINRTVFEVYELSDHDKKMVLDKEGIPVGDLPVSHEAKVAYQQWLMQESKFKPNSEVLEHLENLEERDDLTRVTDFETLYQNNNEWEEFCIKHNLNPVEVWWQFKNANVLPPQRTQVLAFELLTDVIRSLLAKDDDGVIPLTTHAGETNLAPRIEAEMVERGYNAAQIAQVFSLLGGGGLDRYLSETFFKQLSDHLNLFMYLPKTPFIWHITSGPHRALELFVSIYRWNRDTLIRIKSVYAANREAALNDRLQVLLQGNATQRAEAAEVRLQLTELRQFCDKVDALLASGYDPKLDDGVGKNIAPLQKAKLIAYDVLNAGQLKKYLNADW